MITMYKEVIMVKLVIVDLDGTFLDDNKQMSPEFGKVFKALKEKGVQFCATSGRQLASIKEQFNGYEKDMIFIAENGSVVEVDGKIVHVEYLNREITDKILERIKSLKDDKKVIYCTKEYSYIDCLDDEQSRKNAELFLPKHKVVDNFDNIDELPVKFSIYSKDGYDSDFEKLVEEFGDVATVCTSGFEWLDIIPKDSSKGTSIRKIQKMMGITSKETMAFGDQMNDFDMLNSAYYSYAMDNAIDEVKQICRFSAPSNNDYGVVKVLKEFFSID